MKLQLALDDPRLGKFNEEGAALLPKQDFEGNSYEIRECSRFNFVYNETRYFLMVPALSAVSEMSVEIVTVVQTEVSASVEQGVDDSSKKNEPDAVEDTE